MRRRNRRKNLLRKLPCGCPLALRVLDNHMTRSKLHQFISAGIAALSLLLASTAGAQLRTIPDDAKRGTLKPVREMIVEINGDQMRLAPGAQIRNRENRIVLPVALSQQGQKVKYLVDSVGMVQRVWIMTDEEAAKSDKKP